MKKIKHYKIIKLDIDFGNNVKGTIMRVESILGARLIDKKIASIYDGELKPGSVADILEKEEVKPTKKEKKK